MQGCRPPATRVRMNDKADCRHSGATGHLRVRLPCLSQLSPVPEARARADWLLIPQVSIAAVNSSGVFYAYQNGRTTIFDNMAMVDRCVESSSALRAAAISYGRIS